jgi:hypothetical protein
MRYRLRTLMILMAAVALWLSTITGYESAQDVRALLMLSVLVASAAAAISHDGPRRAFWVGFFLTVLPMALGSGSPFLGTAFTFPWAERLLNAYGIFQNASLGGGGNPRYLFLLYTIHVVVLLLIATAMGFLGVLVFKAIDKPK